MSNLLLIAALGASGVLARHGIDQALSRFSTEFPWPTLAINFLGSFLAGLIYVAGAYRGHASTLQAAMLVGFCGGFTTFSAYALQSFLLLGRGRPIPAIAYLVFGPPLCLLAVFIPIWIAKRFIG